MISSDLMDQITQYLNNQITINDLEDWLVPREPWLLRDPISDDADIVGVIELGLAEMGSGIRSEEEFRDFLRNSISAPVIPVWAEREELELSIVTGSSNTVLPVEEKDIFFGTFTRQPSDT